MRTVMLWGGFTGFLLAAVAGFAADRPLDLILRDAAFACLGGAWLLRWWWSQLERALSETLEIRRQRAEAEAAAEAAAEANQKAATSPRTPGRREAANPAMARSAASPSPAAPARL
ncbi:hypothetical protein [Actomonas aquatica]|uniref:Uncharacterized protein n=1 Tax=Actomonas aquatica TaxID=2866162 RepID=A0ABZ1C7A3_9BACT|nr:hypothetical protein [Opitutus sp. WL0086]WRQ87596.1 hypothetical protein K1X11_022505 [Opitutus sp. WL0086]